MRDKDDVVWMVEVFNKELYARMLKGSVIDGYFRARNILAKKNIPKKGCLQCQLKMIANIVDELMAKHYAEVLEEYNSYKKEDGKRNTKKRKTSKK